MKPTEEQKEQWKAISLANPFHPRSISTVELYDVDPVPQADSKGYRKVEGWKGSMVAVVQEDWANMGGNLHGAAAACLIDATTGAALIGISTDTFWGNPPSGVSMGLKLTYCNPAPVGMEIIIENEILKCSPTNASIRCEIKERKTGRLLVSAIHQKSTRAAKL